MTLLGGAKACGTPSAVGDISEAGTDGAAGGAARARLLIASSAAGGVGVTGRDGGVNVCCGAGMVAACADDIRPSPALGVDGAVLLIDARAAAGVGVDGRCGAVKAVCTGPSGARSTGPTGAAARAVGTSGLIDGVGGAERGVTAKGPAFIKSCSAGCAHDGAAETGMPA